MKTDLPKCFSPRERLFLVKSMVKDFKEIFTAMEELMGYQFNINVSGVSCYKLFLSMCFPNNDDFQFVQYGQVSCFSLTVTIPLLGP